MLLLLLDTIWPVLSGDCFFQIFKTGKFKFEIFLRVL